MPISDYMPQQPQHSDPPSSLVSMRSTFDLAYWLAQLHTACIRPFSRRGMGRSGIGTAGPFAALLIIIYAGYARDPVMIRYFWAWLAMVVFRRLTAARFEHTRYEGRFWLVPRRLHEMHARVIEAVSMPVIGGVLSGISEPLGVFISAGFFSFSFTYLVDAAAMARQQEAAHNARVEMEIMQRRFHEDRSWR